MKVDETKSNDLKFGSNTKTCKDLGIGQKGKEGGSGSESGSGSGSGSGFRLGSLPGLG